jgi:hypothetical protein
MPFAQVVESLDSSDLDEVGQACLDASRVGKQLTFFVDWCGAIELG